MATDIVIGGTVVGTIEPSTHTGARQREENILRATLKTVELFCTLPPVDGETADAKLSKIAGTLAPLLGDVTLAEEIITKYRRDYGLITLTQAVDPDAAIPDMAGRKYREMRHLLSAGKLRFGNAPGVGPVRFTVEEDVVPNLPAPPDVISIPGRPQPL